MTLKLLDTTFLVHYWAGRESAGEYLADREDECRFLTTSINLKELAVGRDMQGKLDREALLARFEWVTVVPFDVDHALEAGRLEADLRRPSDVNQDRINSLAGDLLIAGVARSLDADVVTKNAGDFETFDGVTVESY